jgi:hypothetical protein
MSNLPFFKVNLSDGEIKVARPDTATAKLFTTHLLREDHLAAGEVLCRNCREAGPDLADDPMAYTQVCLALFSAYVEAMPTVKVDDAGQEWTVKTEAFELVVKKPSLEVIKLALRAFNTNRVLAGEALLVGGLDPGHPIWGDGIEFSAVAVAVYNAFSAGLPEVTVSLGKL